MSKTVPTDVVAGLTKSAVPEPDVLSKTVKLAVPAVVIDTRHKRPMPDLIVVVLEPDAMAAEN